MPTVITSKKGKTIIKTMHMTMEKYFLIGLIKQRGAKEILSDFTGTDEEAIELIANDPRETFVIGECNNQDEKGFCKGHKPKKETN